jgi:uncharacterized membrane protein
MDYLTVKWLHILSSTLLFGTGMGTAYFMICAVLTRNPVIVAAVGKNVIIADWLFTATTVAIQPITGFYLVHLANISLTSTWVIWSTGLYLLAGSCWLPVVWLQIKMHRLAVIARNNNTTLPLLFWRYFTAWVMLGVPAFIALIIVFYLMVAKPNY